jgi:uncharacterized protein (TIGR03083 family)
MTERSSSDLRAIYREGRERLLALAPMLSPTQLDTLTPTCPAWSVRDIYAHLTGIAVEVGAGRFERRGEPERTAAQVESRRGRSIGEVCDEWRRASDQIEQVIAQGGRALTSVAIDVWTHEQDIANGAGVRSGRDGSGLLLTMNAAWGMKSRLRGAGIAPLSVVSTNVDWVIGDGEPAATLHLDAYEMARAFMGRRSIAQLGRYDWEGDPEPYLDHIPVFAPPEYDIVE